MESTHAYRRLLETAKFPAAMDAGVETVHHARPTILPAVGPDVNTPGIEKRAHLSSKSSTMFVQCAATVASRLRFANPDLTASVS